MTKCLKYLCFFWVIFRCLYRGDLTAVEADYILGQPVANARKKGDRKFGKMREDTRKLLEEFHEPYNKKLSVLLNDNRFMWKDKRQQYTTATTAENPVMDDMSDYREKRSGRSVKRSPQSKLLRSLKQRLKNCEENKS